MVGLFDYAYILPLGSRRQRKTTIGLVFEMIGIQLMIKLLLVARVYQRVSTDEKKRLLKNLNMT